jgi:hypothetical protein
MRSLLALIAVASCCGVMTSCLGQSVVKAEQISPTGKYKAELTEGDTGAVGGWMSAVRISEVNPSTWHRLLGHEGATVFGVDLRSTHVAFSWRTDKHLEVICSGCDKGSIDLRKNNWGDVIVSYEIKSTGNADRRPH